MVFLILLIVFITHLQFRHHHHGGPRGYHHAMCGKRDSVITTFKKDSVLIK